MTAAAILVFLAGLVIGFAGYVWLRARAEVRTYPKAEPVVVTLTADTTAFEESMRRAAAAVKRMRAGGTPIYADLRDEYEASGKGLPS